jgi:plastocyanin
MRAELSRIAALLIVAVTGAGCGSGGTDNSTSVLTTVEVTPATATLFTVAPGNTAALTVVAKDQNGAVMSNAGTTFSSDAGAVATVGTDGTVTALTPGTAVITASLTAGGVTKTGISTVTAEDAPASAGVAAPGFAFNPSAVDVQAGATVTWTFASITHNVTFTTGGAPTNIPDSQNGSVGRTFPTNGSFNYHCTIHPQMTGTVTVH